MLALEISDNLKSNNWRFLLIIEQLKKPAGIPPQAFQKSIKYLNKQQLANQQHFSFFKSPLTCT